MPETLLHTYFGSHGIFWADSSNRRLFRADLLPMKLFSVGARSRQPHRCPAPHAHPLRRSSTLQNRPSRKHTLLYRCALVVPFGFTLYPLLHPNLVEKHPEIVSKYDPNITIGSLIACNAAVFLAWYLGGIGQSFRVPTLMKLEPFMMRHFRMFPDKSSFSPSRWHTFVTYMFSHKSFVHLSANMFTLWSFGKSLHYGIGTELFLAIYLGTCMCI